MPCNASAPGASSSSPKSWGACVLDVFRDKVTHLGNQNVSMAFEILLEMRLPVVMVETGGRKARHVTFYPHTGDLVVRSL
jgi:chemotaxis receptor (MCP) glutamine deamidase CheD